MNDLIPTGPSQKDIQEMARLRAIMNGTNVPAVRDDTVHAHYSGGNAGTRRPLHESHNVAPPAYMPSTGASREDVDIMKNILTKLNAISGDEPAPAPQRQQIAESHAGFVTDQRVGSGPYEVLALIKESGGKEVNRYSVVDSSRRDVIGDLTLRETATALMKLMNKGLTLESARVQEVINLEEDYNRNRIQTASHKSRYQRSMELGETAAAQVFKDRFNVAKANALAAQDEIKSIADSLR